MFYREGRAVLSPRRIPEINVATGEGSRESVSELRLNQGFAEKTTFISA
jgi:hypothetical protein